ncbi:MAG TPA: tRNA pseudouridine(55) synthase TruB, partial [Amycolatopsis sp.]
MSRPKEPRRPAPPPGLLIVDKPSGMTSHDVVARARRI